MLSISVRNGKQDQRIEHGQGPIEFGRGPQRNLPRLLLEDVSVSRDQLRVEELPAGRVRVENLSLKIPLFLEDGTNVPVASSREVSSPVVLVAGQTNILIEWMNGADSGATPPRAAPRKPSDAGESDLGITGAVPDLEEPGTRLLTIDQPPSRSGNSMPPRLFDNLGEPAGPETMANWLETVLALQRSGTSPAEFYEQTAQALVNLVGLDVGLVMLCQGDKWQVVARSAQPGVSSGFGREFSQTILRQVAAEKRTFYQDLGALNSQESLRNIDAVVASPIFGLHEDEVVGAVYGSRKMRPPIKSDGIRPLEAQLVQLLAGAIGANLARTTATKTRVQFEQFFSPELVRELERDPNMLEGRSKEATILVSDLRDFSGLSEQLGPEDTCRLIRDVMEQFSNRIVEHGGVIVSYLGDGILAMWNAPAEQADHAMRACRAALAMQAEVPAINARWQAIVGRPLVAGIGVNTGPVQVGNTGSSRKFMYGPLGHAVNLASRLEGATKQLGIPVLISGSTQAQLPHTFATRRLCQVRVMGTAGVVVLYELQGEAATPDWLTQRDTYEAALALYEAGAWAKASQTLVPLLQQAGQQGQYDKPTLRLLRRAGECLETPPQAFDPVMELTSK
jgi:adenylate cyclase